MQSFQGLGETSPTIDRGHPDVHIPNAGSGGWRGFKEDLLPLMALLGAIYGWVFALLVAVAAAIVLIVR
ncbi:MAG TPA: hypothetical protein VJ935_07790 [Acidimicrobiia bacterium]|nr:hypothetical protein [Acidimicrobiia bacterium]